MGGPGKRLAPDERRASPDGHQGRNDKRQDQAAAPDNRPQEDPAEGSRDTVEHELDRHRQSGSEAPHREAKRARDDLQEKSQGRD